MKEKRAIEGMDREQVLLALGRPVRKVRETKEGEETEDWIYGTPPGKIVFVTFKDNKAIKVKETYAGLGTEAPARTRRTGSRVNVPPDVQVAWPVICYY